MKKNNGILSKISRILSSKVSIFIYLFLFFYLVIFAIACFTIIELKGFAPSDSIQLIMGNYTNVLSALGASIAAGAGTAIHQSVKGLHEKHDKMHEKLQTIHEKLDRLEGKTIESE